MTSLKQKLITGSTAAIAVTFIAASIAFYWIAHRFLLAEMDAGLRNKAQIIASMVEFTQDRVGVDAGDLQRFAEYLDAGGPAEQTEYYQIRTADGARSALSPSLRARGATLPEAQSPIFGELPDGRQGRILSVGCTAALDPDELVEAGMKESPQIVITVARATTALDRLMAQLRSTLAAVLGLGALGLVAATIVIVRRGLQPVNRLAASIASIGTTALGNRLDTSTAPAELMPVVRRLNELLARLEEAFEREKAFTADAAHELRTPLSAVRTALQVILSQPRDGPEYRQTIEDSLEVLGTMQSMVESLLLMARAEAGRTTAAADGAATDLSRTVERACESHATAAARRGLRVEVRVSPGICVAAPPEPLGVVVNNLVQNAVQHSDERGRIEMNVAVDDGDVELTVANTGNRVPPADVHRVFDRFWRADPSRGAGNCGLGLSVCRTLVAVMGGRLQVDVSRDGWFLARLRLRRARFEVSPREAGEAPSCGVAAAADRSA